MKMDTKKIRSELEKRLSAENRLIRYVKDQDALRVEDTTTNKGVTISLGNVLAKWEVQGEKAFDEMVYYVQETFLAMEIQPVLKGNEKNIFPVIRSTSFPLVNNNGDAFLTKQHTAETRIYYALDLGTSYRLLDEAMMNEQNWDVTHVHTMALFNLRSLSTDVKKDVVAGNDFYFLNHQDGYDASRILNESFLREFNERIHGTFAIAIPHQDCLILADIQNDTGYDVLAQVAMQFFASGRVPITALSFLYEDGELEPIFILGKNKRKE